MAGVTRDEGTLLVYLTFPIMQKTFNKTDIIDLMNSVIHPSIYTETAPKFYLSNIDPNNETALRLSFSQFYGDLIITCPTYFFAKQFAQNSPKQKVFFYELTYARNNSKDYHCDTESMGICHGAELEFVFGIPLLEPESSSELDRNFSKKVMSLWTNFAKTGYKF
jgi:carboxylesterase type B